MNPDKATVYDLICRHKHGIKDRDIAKRLGMTLSDVRSITRALLDEKMVMYIYRLGWVVWQKPIRIL